MRIALLQGGGTCPGSNDAHRGLAETAVQQGHEVVVIPFGYKGLITPHQDYANLFSHPLVRDGRGLMGLHRQPGAAPGTSRTKPIPVEENGTIKVGKEEEFHRSADTIRENLTRNRIDILAIVGGDDTLWRGASMLHRHGILRREGEDGEQTVQAVGVPKTIDNDFQDIAYSFGATSAALRGQDHVRDGAVEAGINGKVMVIEVMGRNCGWLPAASAEAADCVLIPEVELPEDAIVRAVQQKIREQGQSLVLVVAEGFRVHGEEIHLAGAPDSFGHRRLGGVRFIIEEWLNKAKIDTMQLCPGYLFRCGPPTERDAKFAYRLGSTAMEAALAGNDGVIAHLPEGSRSLEEPLALMEMSKIRGGKKLDASTYDPDTLQFTHSLMPKEQ